MTDTITITTDTVATDGDLVRRARRRDEDAVRAITNRHNRRLYRIARSILGSADEAEDAVQDAYLRAFTGLDGFRGDSSLGTWLTRIVMNEALGRLRKRRPSVSWDSQSETDMQDTLRRGSLMAGEDDPESQVARSQIRRLIERSIDQLPDAFRTVFVARMVEGLSVAETSELLGIRPETVKTRVHRAHRRLRANLERHLGTEVTGAFPFDGARCERLTDRVLHRLRES